MTPKTTPETTMPETVPSTTPESTVPLAPRRLRPAEIDCKWWKQGYCFHGSECYFRHDPKLIGVNKPKESKEQKEGEDGDAVPSVSVQEQCVICLQIPSTFGLLVNCNHVFCLECIRGWRASGKHNSPSNDLDLADDCPKLKKACKTCPICRTHSDFIIPSSVLPASTQKPSVTVGTDIGSEKGGAKQEIINGYLARLKTIPCQYFEASVKSQPESFTLKPVCRFGNDCHYAHIHPVNREPYIFSSAELDEMKSKRRVKRRAQRLLAEQFMVEEMLLWGLESLELEAISDEEYDSELSS